MYTNYSLSNSNYFKSAKTCQRESSVIDFTSAKIELRRQFSKNCIFPNI